MNSLVFLLMMSVKNSFLELLRKPAKLVLWILVVGGIIGLFFLSAVTRQNVENFHDLIWLKGMLFMLILIFAVVSIKKALSNGDVIFDMNDVNFLFVSPVSSRLILMYGIVRMAKMAFFAGFFILFQSSSLGTSFGVGMNAVFLILIGFILAVSLMQILSLLIYSVTNGNPSRKRAVRMIAILVILPLVTYAAVQLVKTSNLLLALENTLRSPVFSWTPIAGWASEGVMAFISFDIGNGFLFFGLILLAGSLMILYIALSNPDYYEDVLVATETTFEKKRGMSQGQLNTEGVSTKKVKVSKTGIGGFGANAILYKHIRESFRINRFGLWGLSSFFIIIGSAIFSFFIRNGGGLLVLLQTLMWAQIFLIGTGRGLKELYMHYIYMIPLSSFQKMIWSNLEIAVKVFVEALAIFVIGGLITGTSFMLVAGMIAVYVLFSFLLIGINYLSLRWTGADISSGLLILIYMIMVIIIMLPGLIAAIVVAGMLGSNGLLTALGILALWELLASVGCFWLSKGVLHNCDMPVMKTVK